MSQEILKKDFKNLYKFEIMVNHSCPSKCKYWDYHYKKVELDNILALISKFETVPTTWELKDPLVPISDITEDEENV